MLRWWRGVDEDTRLIIAVYVFIIGVIALAILMSYMDWRLDFWGEGRYWEGY